MAEHTKEDVFLSVEFKNKQTKKNLRLSQHHLQDYFCLQRWNDLLYDGLAREYTIGFGKR